MAIYIPLSTIDLRISSLTCVSWFSYDLKDIPFGKHTKNYGKSPCYSWENSRTKW